MLDVIEVDMCGVQTKAEVEVRFHGCREDGRRSKTDQLGTFVANNDGSVRVGCV